MTHINQCEGTCVMCRAEQNWTPETERTPILESMLAGTGFAISAWFAVWFFWSIGEQVARRGWGTAMLVIMSVAGAATGLYTSTVWRR